MKKCKVELKSETPCKEGICCYFCENRENCENVCGDASEICIEQIDEPSEIELIQKAVPEVLTAITELTVLKKQMEEREKLMKEKLLSAMEKYGVKKFENEQVSFTYTPPTKRESIDSKKLKEELPEVAKKYTKVSDVKASVRITVKGE